MNKGQISQKLPKWLSCEPCESDGKNKKKHMRGDMSLMSFTLTLNGIGKKYHLAPWGIFTGHNKP